MKPMPKHIENKIRMMIKHSQQASRIEFEVREWFGKQGAETFSHDWDGVANDQLIDIGISPNSTDEDIEKVIKMIKNEYEKEMGI